MVPEGPGRLPQVFCCRPWDETGIWKEGGSDEDFQLACLFPWPCLGGVFPVNAADL